MIIIKKKQEKKSVNKQQCYHHTVLLNSTKQYIHSYLLSILKKTCEFIQPIPTRVYKTLLTLYPRKNLGCVSPDPGLLVWSGEHRPNNTAARKTFIAQFEKQDAKTIIFLSILA